MLINRLLTAAALGAASATALAVPIQWGVNGHWYEFVGTPVTAPTAFAAAAAASHNGMPGYLATVTSAAENAFVTEVVAERTLIWLGGSDNGAAVNEWTWRVGPETGQAFSYTNWNGGEPNDCCGGENYVHANWGVGGTWNDHGGPGNPAQANGYVVEYSGVVPEPGSYALMALGLFGVAAVSRRRRS